MRVLEEQQPRATVSGSGRKVRGSFVAQLPIEGNSSLYLDGREELLGASKRAVFPGVSLLQCEISAWLGAVPDQNMRHLRICEWTETCLDCTPSRHED